MFDPHHAFVFFDRDETPVALLRVCFTCGAWHGDPAPDERAMRLATAPMRDLARELGLSEWWYGHKKEESLGAALYERGLAPYEHGGTADLGINPNRQIRNLTNARSVCCAGGRTCRGSSGPPNIPTAATRSAVFAATRRRL
jgi:hypothetical protein